MMNIRNLDDDNDFIKPQNLFSTASFSKKADVDEFFKNLDILETCMTSSHTVNNFFSSGMLIIVSQYHNIISSFKEQEEKKNEFHERIATYFAGIFHLKLRDFLVEKLNRYFIQPLDNDLINAINDSYQVQSNNLCKQLNKLVN